MAAFVIFKQQQCDVWVLEVGLGGRLDVVNVIDPDIAVITNIGLDHTDWLGDTSKIAFEKQALFVHIFRLSSRVSNNYRKQFKIKHKVHKQTYIPLIVIIFISSQKMDKTGTLLRKEPL